MTDSPMGSNANSAVVSETAGVATENTDDCKTQSKRSATDVDVTLNSAQSEMRMELPDPIKVEPVETDPIKSEPISPIFATTLDYPHGSSLPNKLQKEQEESPQNMESTSIGIMPSSLDFSKLRRLIGKDSPHDMKQCFRRALTALQELSSQLANITNHADALRCGVLIRNLIANQTDSRTLIILVGDTGAGKSTIINALLGELKILPTNCVRACTAVPTEISWNHSDRPEERYRAEIDFITREEWHVELKHLFSDLRDGTGEVSRNINDKETDAGIAWAKIQAVYPLMDEKTLAKSNANKLAGDDSVQELLGTSHKAKAATAGDLYQQTQKYIDSKEKHSKGDNHGPSALWPLIKVVRLYLKSDILSTGAVLVDLPGVGDSNAARASVASKYFERCHAIWVVAPIARAVGNKSAQHLLGESFKLQLAFDGALSRVSFICSQTDDISIADAVDNLDLRNEYEDALAVQRKQSEILTKRLEIGVLQAEIRDVVKERNSVTKKITTWKNLATLQASGKQAFATSLGQRKRKPAVQKIQANSKRHRSRRNTPFILSSDDESGDEEEEDGSSEKSAPLTTEQITAVLSRLQSEKNVLKKKLVDLQDNIADAEEAIQELEDTYQESERSLLSLCINRRNEYSRKAIQTHFALGVQILDQASSMTQDAENSDPDDQTRDYDDIAQSLPVFCVSSRAYKSKAGLSKEKDTYDGFASLDQTEIPQLIHHAKTIAEAAQMTNHRRFLNHCLQIFQSLAMLLTRKGAIKVFSEDEAKLESQRVEGELEELKKALEAAAGSSADSCRKILEKSLFRKFIPALKKATKAGPAISKAWGARIEDGGYSYQTYRAVCVRHGIHPKAKSGPIDFNEELVKPWKQELTLPWENTFSVEIPKILEQFAETSRGSLKSFHQTFRSRHRCTEAANQIQMLCLQLEAHVQGLVDDQVELGQTMQDFQRETSRELTPTIKNSMKSAYEGCKEVKGPGAFARIKDKIVGGVENLKSSMFNKSTNKVKKGLLEMCLEYEEQLLNKIGGTIDSMTSDYIGVINNRDAVPVPQPMSQAIIEVLSRFNDDLEPIPAISPG